MQELADFIKTHTRHLCEEELFLIISKFRTQTLRKKQLLLKRGQIANRYYYVRSGALRFIYGENQDLTAWIVLPGEFFTEISSFKLQTPTRFNIEAVDDTELCYIERAEMELLYRQLPVWQEFGREVWETMAMRMIDEIIRFQTMTVEERYLEFLRQPGFMQHISVKQLASYLGITPNALSRIRKNIR
ncbi:Crp/Fnr family transcriptional regulator [Chryseobacterium fluminis]|uniref:Crp/Fnr family transcriptional regulator n=1 Tax=Chryseobacterium fluminis TaxID=2983606 RepID=UPI0022554BDD|nr:Crp/Fnr family transcriptional regulator [Chryseobacterium sp. MMS21-Ot14]UZT99164.1 Crp/Fnr family transcriptional regulator [Chryseobacterium sp. MMS21-Ot14]